MHPSTLAKRGIVLVLLVVVAFYLYGLGHLPLVGPDEPRYAQVAREMFLRHDLVTPTLGGRTWFEKPALLYWGVIASFKGFGVSEWAARLPAAISGLLTIAAVYCLSSRVTRQEADRSYAFWSTLAAATMVGIVVFSRAASFDIILTMTTTWSLTFYILNESEERGKLRSACLAGFYVFIGLSLLAKGLVGMVLPFGVVALYHLLCRRLPDRKALLSLFWGLPIALMVSATWYGPVIARNGWPFIDQFFIQHHFARYVSNKYHHSQPVYFYLWIIPLLALPWTAFLIDGLREVPRWLGSATRGNSLGNVVVASGLEKLEGKLMPFALAWFLFPLAFFSFANSKLPGYILPVLPAAALIIGTRLWFRSSDTKETHWTIRTTAILSLACAIGAPAYAWRSGALPIAATLTIAAPLLLAGVFALVRRRQPAFSIILFAAAMLLVLTVLLSSVAPVIAMRETAKHLLRLADARGYSQAVVYGIQRSDRTPEFYAAGRVAYGADGEAIMYQEPLAVIAESRKRDAAVLVFVPLADVGELTAMPEVQTEIIGDNGRYALIAVRTH